MREHLGAYIWATGDTTWAEAIGARLAELGWALAVEEIGTGGQVGALFGDVPWIRQADRAERAEPGKPDEARLHRRGPRRHGTPAGAEVGLAVHVADGGDDAIAVDRRRRPRQATTVQRRTVFLGGANGRTRAALAAAAVLLAAADLTGRPTRTRSMREMSAEPAHLLRLTVLGCSTAAPHPGSPAAGFLVEWGATALMLDVGQGAIRRLERVLDPHDLSAVVIGHMHADHYLDLVGLRYLFAWGEATPGSAAGPPAAGRPGPARRAGRGDQRAGRLLRCRLRRRRVRPGSTAPGRAAASSGRSRPSTTSRPGASSSRRRTALASPTPATPVRATRSSRRSAARTCSWWRPPCVCRRTTTRGAAT